LSKQRKYKIRWSISEKILAVLSIISFVLIVTGIFVKHWRESDSESIPKPAKAEQIKNKNW